MSKSKLYESSERKPIFEFAKRLGVNGNEITGIPYDLLKVSSSSIYSYVDLVIHLFETSLFSDHSILEYPTYLNPQGVQYLQILLWEKGYGCPAWLLDRLGNTLDTPLLNALRTEVAKVRIAGFQELIGKLDQLCYSSDLEQELTKSGVAFTETLIGHGNEAYHPIIHSLNAVGMEMYETLPILEAIVEQSSLGEITLPELTQIEYLPLPIMAAHFERPGKRNPERLKRHSQLVLTAYNLLKVDPKGFVLK